MGSRLAYIGILRRCTELPFVIALWFIIVISASICISLFNYWPMHKAEQYFNLMHDRLDNYGKGSVRFFIERQRRAIFELSRSEYMHHLLTFVQGSAETTEQQRLKMESFIKGFQEYFSFKQIFLIDTKGAFIFSTMADKTGKNIHDPAYKDSVIIDSFKLSEMTLTSDISVYTFDPIVGEKALFIIMPVFYANELKGFLAVQLDSKQIEALLVQKIDLGTTGQYLITQVIKDTITFVVPPADRPNLTFPVRPEIDATHGTLTERSALGYNGFDVLLDNQGIKVAGAWYFIPQINWGYLCKTDYAEIVRPIYWFGYGILLLCALAIVLTGLYISRIKQAK